MLPKLLNTAKLKVKYVLGNHTTQPGYPDAEDVLFELIRDYCGKVAKEIKFTDVSMAKRWNLSKERCDNAKKQFNKEYKNYWCISSKTI